MLLTFVKPLVIFLVAFAVLLLIRRLVHRYLERHSKGIPGSVTILQQAIHGPAMLWCFALALTIALRNSTLTDRQEATAERLIISVVIFSMTLAFANVLSRSFTLYGERRKMPFAVAGLSRTLIYVVVLILGLLSMLSYLNFQITPLLTALGVGGLAVALALQDTLANFFAGIHILIENPIAVGEVIKLSSGEEGTVADIGWRTTRVRTGQNNIIVIPNTKITTGILINYNLPSLRVMAEVAVITGLDADPDKVRQLALETIANVPGVLADPAPAFAFDPGVTANNMQSKVSFWSENRAAMGSAQSEFRMRLVQRFREAQVPMPMPGRS